ncbi:MAG TPA: 30S ribosomal protein S6 [Verrucomicrobiae bacterium]|nr:30S ribosomal protein S6 [Verrucomicrobiae bacterium]HTZ54213.1 30S ribosomal protein S6 [Candidatus Acidoferrum sp.]
MNDYEVTYILRPNFEEAEVEARANAIGEIIKNQGGSVVNIEKLGRKRLAYEIADLREGNYVAMHFRSSGDASKELERQLKLQEDVLRALVIHLDKKTLAAMAHALANPPPAPVPLTPPMSPADRAERAQVAPAQVAPAEV